MAKPLVVYVRGALLPEERKRLERRGYATLEVAVQNLDAVRLLEPDAGARAAKLLLARAK